MKPPRARLFEELGRQPWGRAVPPEVCEFLLAHWDSCGLLFDAWHAEQHVAASVIAGELLVEARREWPRLVQAPKLRKLCADLFRVVRLMDSAIGALERRPAN